MLYRDLEEMARKLREDVAGLCGDGPAGHAVKVLAGECDALAVKAAVLEPEVPEHG